MSEIIKFYKDSSIFLTGCTGFLGKILLEKLLRSCQVKKVYCLVRDKKNKIAVERYNEMLESPMFDKLKLENPTFKENLCLVHGDCYMEDFNLSPAHRKLLIDEVSVVFHVAATIRFDQVLKAAVQLNVKATKYLIDLAKDMKQLKAIIYTSTAYSNCDKEEIHERIYKNRFGVEKFLRFVEDFDAEFIDSITPIILGKLPNTYVLTKALAEELILEHGKTKCQLPVVIVRPSILSSTFEEPLPGWIDSWYTIASISAAGSYGLLRSVNTDPEKLTDIVPTDYVANCLIASSLKAIKWNKETVEVPILNYVCSVEAPITWGKYTEKCMNGLEFVPSQCVRYPCVKLTKYRFVHRLRCFYMHDVPAYIVDGLAFLIGSNFSVRFYYRLINGFLNDTAYFGIRDWKFYNTNVQNLWASLSAADQQTFPFSLKDFDWDKYMQVFLRHGRVHLLKEHSETIPLAQKRLKLLKIIHYAVIILEYFFLLLITYWILKYFDFIS